MHTYYLKYWNLIPGLFFSRRIVRIGSVQQFLSTGKMSKWKFEQGTRRNPKGGQEAEPSPVRHKIWDKYGIQIFFTLCADFQSNFCFLVTILPLSVSTFLSTPLIRAVIKYLLNKVNIVKCFLNSWFTTVQLFPPSSTSKEPILRMSLQRKRLQQWFSMAYLWIPLGNILIHGNTRGSDA